MTNQTPWATQPPVKRRRTGLLLAVAIGAGLLVQGVGGVVALATIGAANTPTTQLAEPSTTRLPTTAKGTTAVAPTTVTAASAPSPSPSPSPAPTGPRTEFGQGTYQVGVDIAPGRYKTPGPEKNDPFPSCYWARLKNDSGEFAAIIANNNLGGPGSITVRAGEFVEANGSCTWTLSP